MGELLLTIITSVTPKGKPTLAYVSLTVAVCHAARISELMKIRNLWEGAKRSLALLAKHQ
jgi:hypothetical protein